MRPDQTSCGFYCLQVGAHLRRPFQLYTADHDYDDDDDAHTSLLRQTERQTEQQRKLEKKEEDQVNYGEKVCMRRERAKVKSSK